LHEKQLSKTKNSAHFEALFLLICYESVKVN
jgi:hypothetical protein